MENIGLQDSLLSRFDLIFVLLDLVDTEDDKRISDHVVRMHRYRNPAEQDGDVLAVENSVENLCTYDLDENEPDQNDIFEKYDPLLHGSTRSRKLVCCHNFFVLLSKICFIYLIFFFHF